MLVLASASPRRKELLTQAGFSFHVLPSPVPEELMDGEDATMFAMRLAREKARYVFELLQEKDSADGRLLVLGADTVVVSPGEILGKPRDEADAARMLRLLSGRTHQVITGVCLVSSFATEVACEKTSVAVQTLSDEEIAGYIATREPMDKAGAYGIQGYAARWIPRIDGCYFNVVGLPLALVASMIEGMHRRLRAAEEASLAS